MLFKTCDGEREKKMMQKKCGAKKEFHFGNLMHQFLGQKRHVKNRKRPGKLEVRGGKSNLQAPMFDDRAARILETRHCLA